MIEKNEIKSSAHSKYRCQYHIMFAPKYRRKEIYGQLKKDIGDILRKLCEQRGVEIIEAEACVDHIHRPVYGQQELKGKRKTAALVRLSVIVMRCQTFSTSYRG